MTEGWIEAIAAHRRRQIINISPPCFAHTNHTLAQINNGNNANALRDEYEEEEVSVQAFGEENNKPLWEQKHKNFLKKKTGDYRGAEEMSKLNLGRRNEEILAKPSPRVEEKRSQPRKPALHNQRASLKPRAQKVSPSDGWSEATAYRPQI